MVNSYRLAGAADIDPWAIATYTANLPITPKRVDLAQATSSEDALDQFVADLHLRSGSPLVLVGGPPCQGFSAHRKKDGKPHDPRNDLVQAFATIVARLKPDIMVMENVPEVLAKKHWNQFEQLKQTLLDMGYFLKVQIHNLASFGVPQERFRALIIASKRPLSMPVGFLDGDHFRTVREAIGLLPAIEPGQPNDCDPMHVCSRHKKSTVETICAVSPNGGNRPKGVGPECLDRVDGFRDVYGRMFWDKPANTITAYARNPASGRFAHPDQHRGLTIREASLLQGFPRNFEFQGPFDQKFVQIGNAVPPIFSAYLASHLLGELLIKENSSADAHSREIHPTSDSFSSGIAGRKKGRKSACSVNLS
jgi:DNA (cytosine-5)-methyltransferase 1